MGRAVVHIVVIELNLTQSNNGTLIIEKFISSFTSLIHLEKSISIAELTFSFWENSEKSA